ncbi:MAG: alpha/beta fold hydrolase [Acidobacteriota bacterium]|nr:alpha/beta fold hydrolase [Acidobacteriota bacterium]
MTTRIVLVPGFWLGQWAWDEVVPALREQGFDVVALTLPGLEPERHPEVTVTLADQADAIEAALDVAAERRILVVHSGAAFPGTLVIDRRPDLVDRFVLVDTAPPKPGLAFNSEQVGDFTLADAWSQLQEEGSLNDLTEAQLETFRERAIPQPAALVTEAIELTNEARHHVPVTVICTEMPASAYQDYAAQGVPFLAALLDYSDIAYVDLPTGHWPMWSKPVELAEAIAQASRDD